MWFKPGEYQQTNSPVIATTAITATKAADNPGLSQKSQVSQRLAFSIHPNGPSNAVATGLNAGDREKLLDYLAAIGETDQDMIDEVLTECGKDAAILVRALQQADDYLRINSGDTTGLVQCSGCRQLSSDACQRYGWRVVVDKWRQCGGFEVLQKTTDTKLITCKACRHFQSYHPHGGGAGVCGAGVQPFGACWWADTLHECDQWSAKHD